MSCIMTEKKTAKKTTRKDSLESLKEKAKKLKNILSERYPQAGCALDFATPWQLLAATILSAQCTDARVNIVTKVLFKKYPDPESTAKAEIKDLERIVYSTGFYKNKAKSLSGAAQAIIERFNGKVPEELEDLITLPGVGRKTANVVLGTAFGKASGVVVDTHVSRLSSRLGLSSGKNAEKIEADLMKILPQDYWIVFSHYLILYGREICSSRNPKCESCVITELCEFLKQK